MMTKRMALGIAALIIPLLAIGSIGLVNQESARPDETARATSQASAISTSDPTPTDEASSVELPADAQYKAEGEASNFALKVVTGYLRAENPRILSVDLITLEDALTRTQQMTDEDPALAVEGIPSRELTSPVWLVELEGDAFYIPRCPRLTDDQGTVQPCGSGKQAVFIFQAQDGIMVQIHLPGAG